jgi:hypothetical protein
LITIHFSVVEKVITIHFSVFPSGKANGSTDEASSADTRVILKAQRVVTEVILRHCLEKIRCGDHRDARHDFSVDSIRDG